MHNACYSLQTVVARSEKIAEDERKLLVLTEAAQRDLDEAVPALEEAIKVTFMHYLKLYDIQMYTVHVLLLTTLSFCIARAHGKCFCLSTIRTVYVHCNYM